MSLDATAREANLRDSIKKYLIDSFFTTEKIQVLFDKFLTSPKVQGHSVNRWIGIHFGTLNPDTLSTSNIEIYCCTRQDPENFRLSQLRDTVMDYLTPSSDESTFKSIPFYRSKADGNWTIIGGLMVTNIIQSDDMEGPDQTKFKILFVELKYAAKL
jgi:hypothetical protein